MLAYEDWIEEQILVPVPHCQYVFALPKLVRPYCRHHRAYLGEPCRLIAEFLGRRGLLDALSRENETPSDSQLNIR